VYIHWLVYIEVMARSANPTRERIILAASSLFYNEGIRAVSVDAVAAKAGLTKRTLYYHFRSKDDLVAAYLAARDQPNLALFKRWFAEADGELPDKMEAIFRNLARSASHPKWKGCGFLRTSAELANMPGHPAMKISAAHKKIVRGLVAQDLRGRRDGERRAAGTADAAAPGWFVRRGPAAP
jgi:AcrR family transcriptional regulator